MAAREGQRDVLRLRGVQNVLVLWDDELVDDTSLAVVDGDLVGGSGRGGRVRPLRHGALHLPQPGRPRLRRRRRAPGGSASRRRGERRRPNASCGRGGARSHGDGLAAGAARLLVPRAVVAGRGYFKR